jgi:hypothetical protein
MACRCALMPFCCCCCRSYCHLNFGGLGLKTRMEQFTFIDPNCPVCSNRRCKIRRRFGRPTIDRREKISPLDNHLSMNARGMRPPSPHVIHTHNHPIIPPNQGSRAAWMTSGGYHSSTVIQLDAITAHFCIHPINSRKKEIEEDESKKRTWDA